MRQLLVNALPDENGIVELTGKDFHYIRQVLRLVPGDMVKVNASGQSLDMTVCSADDKNRKICLQKCDVQISSSTSVNQQDFYLFQIIPKPQKMELIVRQAVECGVKKIIPVIGEYTQSGTEKSLMEKTGNGGSGRNDRFSRIIREARQQSGSPVETELLNPLKLDEAIDYWKKEISAYENMSVLLYERSDETKTFSELVKERKTGTEKIKLAVFVGCEGGISPQEFKKLKDAGFDAVHLNVNILRCETAALYGIAALQTAAEGLTGGAVNGN